MGSILEAFTGHAAGKILHWSILSSKGIYQGSAVLYMLLTTLTCLPIPVPLIDSAKKVQ